MTIRQKLIFALVILFSSGLNAQQKFQTLNEINYTANTITFKLSGASKFRAFKIAEPAPIRLVIDFTDVEHNLKTKEINVADNKIFSKIRSGQFQNEPIKIARAVIELKSDTRYEVKSENSNVVVNFITTDTTSEKKPTPTTAEKPASPAPAKSTPAAKPPATPKVEVSTTPKPIEVVAVPIEDEQPSQPQTPAQQIKISTPPARTSPEVRSQASAKSTDTAVPEKKITTLTPIKKEEPKPKKLVLPKTLVSFDFHEADIRDVFRVLSAQSGINIIYGPDVKGTITVTLKNVPFDQAFTTILTLKGLVSQEVGSNIIRVLTPEVLAEERSKAVTFTKMFPLNYAKAEDVKAQLDAIRSAEGRRGIITVDQRTNTLVITDTQEGLEGAARLIMEIDKKPWQVLIEAKLVEVNVDKSFDFGVEWQMAAGRAGQDEYVVGITDTGGDAGKVMGVGAGAKVVVGAREGGTGVSALPGSTIGGFTFGYIKDNMLLNANLRAAESKGVAKILSNPRVTTLNNQEAKILVTQKIPYIQQTTQLGTVTGAIASEVQWMDVGITLKVTPTINADRQVTLKVLPQVKLLVRMDKAGPVIGSREAETNVMVKDGETVVIGGLIKEDEAKLVTQVPLLGDIPILGALFKRQLDTKTRSELLVFITPQILTD